MLEPTADTEQRWSLFHTAVMKLAKEMGFDGCVVAAFSLERLDAGIGARLLSTTASHGEVQPNVIHGIHLALAQRLVGLSDSDLNGHRPLAEA